MKPRLGVELGVEALPKKRAEGRRAAASTRTSKRGSRRFPTIWHACAGFENVRLRIAQKKAAANDDCGRWRRVTTLHASRRHPGSSFAGVHLARKGGTLARLSAQALISRLRRLVHALFCKELPRGPPSLSPSPSSEPLLAFTYLQAGPPPPRRHHACYSLSQQHPVLGASLSLRPSTIEAPSHLRLRACLDSFIRGHSRHLFKTAHLNDLPL